MSQYNMEEFVKYCKEQGFVYQGSDIYGGLANSWDYGFLGVELKNNIKNVWWNNFISSEINNVGIDSAIIMNSDVWKASGHIGGFNDPLIDCRDCKERFRADKVIEENEELLSKLETVLKNRSVEAISNSELGEIFSEYVTCPSCGSQNWTDIREFELMFKTSMGVVQDGKATVYLRPETAQGIFINFKNIQRTSRKKLPLGIGQIGKSFRNEITPGNFIFRTREFEQMELEFFCKPTDASQWYEYYQKRVGNFLEILGLDSENIRRRDHDSDELAHYSNATCDFEYKFPFGWGELWGISNRTDFDLKRHQEVSKQDMQYLDPVTNEKYVPYCIEPSVGVDRLMLAILLNSLKTDVIDEEKNETRVLLDIHPALAPFKVAVMPLAKKYHGEKAREILETLSKEISATFDEAGSIGKRYRRQDAIGTPYVVTIDDQTKEDNTFTVRFRNTMKQERLSKEELFELINRDSKNIIL